jgi:hypothetical protein
LQLLDSQLSRLDQAMAELLCPYQDQVQRLAEVPGLGVDSAQQILAEVGPTAAPFPSAGQRLLGGRLPRRERDAEVNYSHASGIRGTRPSPEPKVQAPPDGQNDPRTLRSFGYRVELASAQSTVAPA